MEVKIRSSMIEDMMKSPELTGDQAMDQKSFQVSSIVKAGKHGQVVFCNTGDESPSSRVAIKKELIKSPHNPYSRPYREYLILQQLGKLSSYPDIYPNPQWVGFIAVLDWFKVKSEHTRILSMSSNSITPRKLFESNEIVPLNKSSSLITNVPKTAPRSVKSLPRTNTNENMDITNLADSVQDLSLTPSKTRPRRAAATPTPKKTLPRTPMLMSASKTAMREIRLQEGNLVLERADTTLHEQKHDLSYDTYRSILFQIIFALLVSQTEFRFVHNDLHLENVLLKKVRGGKTQSADIDQEIGIFKHKDITWYTNGPWIVKLSDFGLSRIDIAGRDDQVVYDVNQPMSAAFMADRDLLKVLEEFSKVKVARWLYRCDLIDNNANISALTESCFSELDDSISMDDVASTLQDETTITKLKCIVAERQKSIKTIKAFIRKYSLHMEDIIRHEFFAPLMQKPKTLLRHPSTPGISSPTKRSLANQSPKRTPGRQLKQQHSLEPELLDSSTDVDDIFEQNSIKKLDFGEAEPKTPPKMTISRPVTPAHVNSPSKPKSTRKLPVPRFDTPEICEDDQTHLPDKTQDTQTDTSIASPFSAGRPTSHTNNSSGRNSAQKNEPKSASSPQTKTNASASPSSPSKKTSRRTTMGPKQIIASIDLSTVDLSDDQLVDSVKQHLSRMTLEPPVQKYDPVPARFIDPPSILPMLDVAPINVIDAYRDYLTRLSQKREEQEQEKKPKPIKKFFIRDHAQISAIRKAKLARKQKSVRSQRRSSLGSISKYSKPEAPEFSTTTTTTSPTVIPSNSRPKRRNSISSPNELPNIQIIEPSITPPSPKTRALHKAAASKPQSSLNSSSESGSQVLITSPTVPKKKSRRSSLTPIPISPLFPSTDCLNTPAGPASMLTRSRSASAETPSNSAPPRISSPTKPASRRVSVGKTSPSKRVNDIEQDQSPKRPVRQATLVAQLNLSASLGKSPKK